MLNKNTMLAGMLIGLILPLFCVLVFEVIFHNPAIAGKHGLPYLVAIAINLVLLKYFAKKDKDKTMQGIMLITFVCMLLVFVFRFKA